jgi:hypothetical protein
MTSTPRRSRYSVRRYDAIRVSVRDSLGATVVGATVLIRLPIGWLKNLGVVELAEEL